MPKSSSPAHKLVEKYQPYIVTALASAVISGGGVLFLVVPRLRPKVNVIQPPKSPSVSSEAPPVSTSSASGDQGGTSAQVSGVDSEAASGGAPAVSQESKASEPPSSQGKLINVNTASRSELESLPGIGPTKAGSIIDYRSRTPFRSAREITKVNGIGEKTYGNIRDLITVE